MNVRIATPLVRRSSLAGTMASGLVGSNRSSSAQTSEGIPFTSGAAMPKVAAPAFACDCHFHIYDSRFPADRNASINPPDALVPDYLRLRARLGLGRGVVVTPSTYGTDNACTLDAITHLGESARGVAVVNTAVTDDELKHLDAHGIRGIRFNLARAGATTVGMIEPLAHRVADMGWHVQVHMPADDIAKHARLLGSLPVPVVFDHLGRIPQPQGTSHPAYGVVLKMLRDGKAWVKVSGAYQDTTVGPRHMRMLHRSRDLTSRPHLSGSCGGAIGHIRPKAPMAFLTMRCCLTWRLNGPKATRSGNRCWSTIPRGFTASRKPPEGKSPHALSGH